MTPKVEFSASRRGARPARHPGVVPVTRLNAAPAAHALGFELCGLHARLVFAAHRVTLERQPVVCSHADVAPLLAHFVARPRSGLFAGLLNRHGALIAVARVNGAGCGCDVGAGAIYRAAIAAGARALYLAHGHADAAPRVSSDDLACAARAYAFGFALGLELRDSLIFGADGRYVSLRERGEGVDDWRHARERNETDLPRRCLRLHQAGANRRPERPGSSRSDGARAALWRCPACERQQNYKHACRYCGAPRPGEDGPSR